MSDKAVLVVLLYILFSFVFGVLIGKMIKVGRGEEDEW
jgi:hypothetical protein